MGVVCLIGHIMATELIVNPAVACIDNITNQMAASTHKGKSSKNDFILFLSGNKLKPKKSKYSVLFDLDTEADTAICKKCGDRLSMKSRSTSGLRYHAENKHNFQIGPPKKKAPSGETGNSTRYWP